MKLPEETPGALFELITHFPARTFGSETKKPAGATWPGESEAMRL